MATSASTTTTRMAAATSTAAVGSRPKIRCDSPELRGDAATSPLPAGAPGFVSVMVVVVDELEDGLGACDADGVEGAADGADEDEDVALDEESSAFGAAADDELELLDLSPGMSFCWVWALDELSAVCAMAAEPSPRIMSALRMAAKRDFFMVHLPEGIGATAMPPRCGSLT
jgi:hypothetical protein